ncbi:MAG: hypothetical protein ACMVY4_15770 [Minwuia sp.]|uniref:hypothetical protein n=1 Tax=Minwuia sp. TaxID=2493630 RepID=UPI003A8A2979
MTPIRRLLLPLLLLALASCTTYSAINTGDRHEMGDGMSVQVIGEWSAINAAAVGLRDADAMWTVDGLSLNRLVFYGGLEDGEHFVSTGQEDQDRTRPVFRSTMSETAVMELVEASFAKSRGVVRAEASRLRPHPFLGRNGFAFEVDLINSEQVELRTHVTGAVVGGKLYLIYFAAPKLHFFDKDSATVNAIINSARLVATDA